MKFSRRSLFRRLGYAGAGVILGPKAISERVALERSDRYKTYFGDLHNHNEVGYAQGSLQRAYEIGRNHLDFMAFTPHAYWHDIGTYSGGIEQKWLEGFEVTRRRWPEVVETARRFDDGDRFVTILGYEWHSTSLGDYHVLFPDLEAELFLPDTLDELQAFARNNGCILVPHHPANPPGHRGANFAHRSSDVSPVLEIFSEWGNAEHDRAPYPYKRHTEGGRSTKNTLHWLLAQGHRFGVLASTDDHLGYPGAYREGLAAVKVTSLSRENIMDAIRNRRTYAVTGDRIEVDFEVNGRIMGQELAFDSDRRIAVDVTGWDQIDRVEVLKNNEVIYRDFPMDRSPTRASWMEPVIVRFDYGWGPWPALGWDRTADWNFEVEVENGRIEDLQTCFCTGPLDENRRDRVAERSERHVRVISFTSLKQQVDDFSQKGIVLKLEGGPDTILHFRVTAPAEVSQTFSLGSLAESNEPIFTRPFPWESAMVRRVVFADRYRTAFSVDDTGTGERDDWYYLRVVQANEQLAWSSPIWVNKRV